VLDPDSLYTLNDEQPRDGELDRPVLVHAMSGFVDAGSAGRLAAESLLSGLGNRVLATFDVDQLYDYRARRPAMLFAEDHWESYDAPQLTLRLVQDTPGTPVLLLVGPEPDVQWERFVAAVTRLVERYKVRLSVGVNAIPMAVPHTRPIGVTAHGSSRELVKSWEPWVGRVQVPGHIAGLLELRLGEAGHPSAGLAVHVPHYLSQAEYPDAAVALLEGVAAMGDLRLPTGDLREAGERTRSAVDEQIAEQPEVAAVVSSLEQQYDAIVATRQKDSPPEGRHELPSADELGAELERFLAREDERRGRGEV
jgi:predicted ATP-grasp superfamily ATP-dependent carboligase